MITLKEAITNTVAKFDHAIAGVLYYNLQVGDKLYLFEIDMNDKDDVGTTTFESEYKGITLMRYIRRALEKEQLIHIG